MFSNEIPRNPRPWVHLGVHQGLYEDQEHLYWESGLEHDPADSLLRNNDRMYRGGPTCPEKSVLECSRQSLTSIRAAGRSEPPETGSVLTLQLNPHHPSWESQMRSWSVFSLVKSGRLTRRSRSSWLSTLSRMSQSWCSGEEQTLICSRTKNSRKKP